MRLKLLCLTLPLLVACGSKKSSPSGGGGSGGNSNNIGGNSNSFTGPQLKFFGHNATSAAGGTILAWTGSGVEVRATGPTLSANMTNVGSKDNNIVDVLIDGAVQPQTITLAAGVASYPISGLDSNVHTIRLVKRTEAGLGTINFTGFTGTLEANTATPNGRYVEFIGDSISAGYGVLSTTGATCPTVSGGLVADPNFEDGLLSYGVQTALTLNADWAIEAWSGKGLFVNRTPATDPNTMPTLYNLTNPVDPSSTTYTPDPNKMPSAVVINLGTNDFTQANLNAPNVTPQQFSDAGTKLVTAVRAAYPEANIFLALGPMLTDSITTNQGKQLTLARQGYQGIITAMSSDTKLQLIEFTPNAGTQDYGCDYHPNTAKQASMAAQLADVIKTAAGW